MPDPTASGIPDYAPEPATLTASERALLSARRDVHAPPPVKASSLLPPTNIVRPLVTIDEQQLTVSHVDDSATIRFDFGGRRAELGLDQAKALAAALTADLERWRDTVNVQHAAD